MFKNNPFSISDNYINELFLKNGYGKNKPRLRKLLKILKDIGYSPNDYALEVLRQFCDIRIESNDDNDHYAVKLNFSPLTAAIYRYDIERFSSESAFPIGMLFENVVYVTSSHKVYSSDGIDYYFWGDSIEVFLISAFCKDSNPPQVLYKGLRLGSSLVDGRREKKHASDFALECFGLPVSDLYIRELFCSHGYGRNDYDIEEWIQILEKQGYVPNDYVINVLKKFGGISLNAKGDVDHYAVQIWFNPIFAAEWKFDKDEPLKAFCSDSLFPVGMLFDEIVYVSETHEVYSSSGDSCSYWGDSIEDFLLAVFRKDTEGRKLLYNRN